MMTDNDINEFDELNEQIKKLKNDIEKDRLKTHEIKLDISFCDLVYKGVKTFEVRRNDRDYKIGDFVKFNPVGVLFQPVEHPIKNRLYRITYILEGWGIQEGFCVFAIEDITRGEWLTKEGYDGDEYYECSICKDAFTLMYGTPKDNNYNFCPNCGAKMKGANNG